MLWVNSPHRILSSLHDLRLFGCNLISLAAVTTIPIASILLGHTLFNSPKAVFAYDVISFVRATEYNQYLL